MLNFKNLSNYFGFLRDLKRSDHRRVFGALDILKYIGPGLLVTVGFIDPGNWAAKYCNRVAVWVHVTMGYFSFHNYADCTSA